MEPLSTKSGQLVKVGDIWEYTSITNERKRGIYLILSLEEREFNEDEKPETVAIAWNMQTRKKTWLAFKDVASNYILLVRINEDVQKPVNAAPSV